MLRVMTEEQKGVALGALSAAVASVIVLGVSYYFLSELLVQLSLSAREASALIALALLFTIGHIGNKRYFHEDIIQGQAYDKPGNRLQIDKAVLQNTLEQTILAITVYGGLEAITPDLALLLLPGLVFLFLLGRLFFTICYAKGAHGRAFGFGLTFYPTVFAFVVFLIHLFF